MASNGSRIRLVAFDEQQKLPASVRNVTVESVESFQELTSCISFIENQAKENKIVFLITTTVDDNILQKLESITVIEAIFILSTINTGVETLPSKVIGVFAETETLLRLLSETTDQTELRLNASSFLFNHTTDGNDNMEFYFYDLWRNYDEDKKGSKKSLADEARLIFRSNNQIKTLINLFETTYKSTDIVSWLDKRRHPFPYHLFISNALHSHNQRILSNCRFFLDDLTKQMKLSLATNSFKQVYLGTKLPLNLIEQLDQRTKTDTIAFQCFLPTTPSRASALIEATRPICRQNMVNVLFKIELNNASCAVLGDTTLIDMATPFQIVCVTRSSGTAVGQQTLTVIKLTALDKTARGQLVNNFIERQNQLGRSIKDLLQKMNSGISDDEALADEHLLRKEWSQAANTFARIVNPNVRVLNKHGCLLREHLHNPSGALHCHQQALSKATSRERAETLVYLGLAHKGMKQHAEAYKVYREALEWFENEKIRDPGMIARCFTGLGNAQWALKKLPEALDYAERALAIREHEIKPKSDIDIAACLGNMSNILHDLGNRERALSCASRAVDLLSVCAENDPRLGAACNNLGAMYLASGDYVKGREYLQRAIHCVSNENHPYRKSALNNIARLDALGKSSK